MSWETIVDQVKKNANDWSDDVLPATYWSFKARDSHLISGIVFRYYSDVAPWYPRAEIDAETDKTRRDIMTQTNLMYVVPRTIFIDLKTVYESNPFFPRQIYQMTDYNTGLSGTLIENVANDSWEIKFPPGKFLFQLDVLKDHAGNVGGIQVWCRSFKSLIERENYNATNENYKIGEAWNFSWGYVDTPDIAKRRYVCTTYASPDGQPWIQTLGGRRSTFDPTMRKGRSMDFEKCAWVNPKQSIGMFRYRGDNNYKCCFDKDPTKCGYFLNKEDRYGLCWDAKQVYCAADAKMPVEKQDHNCTLLEESQLVRQPFADRASGGAPRTPLESCDWKFIMFVCIIISALMLLGNIYNDERITDKLQQVDIQTVSR